MKKKRLAILFIILLSCTFISSSSMAARFTKDGYTIEIYWKQKGDKLKVWGQVRGGKACQQLNLSLFFANSQDTGSGHVEAYIKDYRPTGRNNYRAKDNKVYVDRKASKHWHVDAIYTNCL